MVEAIGHTGIYDYVEFVAEYGSFDLHDLDNLCRAAELHNMGTIDQGGSESPGVSGAARDGAGFSSVLFTDCRSAADVRECIRQAKPDTPGIDGMYGVATRRNTYMGYGGSAEYMESLDDVVMAVMIEKKGAVDELEEILEFRSWIWFSGRVGLLDEHRQARPARRA